MASNIANPGCFPTGVGLGLAPLLADGLVLARDVVVVAGAEPARDFDLLLPVGLLARRPGRALRALGRKRLGDRRREHVQPIDGGQRI